MHATVASALYRGHTRKLRGTGAKPPAGRVRQTRSAFVRNLIKAYERSPFKVLLLPPEIEGEGKRAKAHMVGVGFAEHVTDPRRSCWVGFCDMVTARDFSLDHGLLPVRLTSHLIERTMQRLDISNPKEAIKTLWLPFQTALFLGPPREQALLPHPFGAVIAVRDESDPEDWALVTFVDAGKLSQEQIAEAQWNGRRAIQHWKTTPLVAAHKH